MARRLGRVDDDAFWAKAGGEAASVEIRDRWGRHTLRLDPREYFQRWAWLLGRYHEWPLQVLLAQALRPGDAFVDVGANLGLVTLRAADLVGTDGCVVAFEPNPEVFRQLAGHVERNGLSNVVCQQVALGRRAGTATLRLTSANTGAGSIADLPWTRGADVTHSCRVVRGDGLLAGPRAGPPCARGDRPMFIKIDVEGFECEALAGLSRTIAAHKPAIVCEVNRPCLRAAGGGLKRLRRMLERRGYRAFLFDSRRTLLGRSRLVLTPFTRAPRGLFDMLFVHPHSAFLGRLTPFVNTEHGDVPLNPARDAVPSRDAAPTTSSNSNTPATIGSRGQPGTPAASSTIEPKAVVSASPHLTQP